IALGDLPGDAVCRKAVGFRFSVEIVGEGSRSGSISDLRQLTEVIVDEALAGRGVRVADSHQKIPVDKAG
ncbi:MAG: hypothetical protein LUD70_21450, partial [Bacteroides ovatus]|nr:hypothetical protein [Bacteroides ovatus]